MSYPAITNPAIPYVGQIPGRIQAGTIIRIQGTTYPSAQCFAINLQCGPRTQPRDDIALHLSPVFSPPPRLVRNSLQGQRWGPEESHGGHFPFVAGQSFEILILTEQERFMIAVNGAHYTEFQHRIPLHSVTYLAIDGQVNITLINFDNAGHSSQPGQDLGFAGGFVAPQPFGGSTHLPGGPGYPTGQLSFPTPEGVVPPPPPPYTSQPTGFPGPAPGYPSATASYPTQSPVSPGYPTQPAATLGYPTQPAATLGYPTQPAVYPTQSYPGATLQPPLAGQPYGTQPGTHIVYPHTSPKRSSPIPIGTLGAGVAAGAAALAGAALMGRSPLKHGKKLKKLYKHKMKWHKPKWHKFSHKWHGHSSSSSSEEE